MFWLSPVLFYVSTAWSQGSRLYELMVVDVHFLVTKLSRIWYRASWRERSVIAFILVKTTRVWAFFIWGKKWWWDMKWWNLVCRYFCHVYVPTFKNIRKLKIFILVCVCERERESLCAYFHKYSHMHMCLAFCILVSCMQTQSDNVLEVYHQAMD